MGCVVIFGRSLSVVVVSVSDFVVCCLLFVHFFCFVVGDFVCLCIGFKKNVSTVFCLQVYYNYYMT